MNLFVVFFVRERLAEERRRKAAAMLEKLRSHRPKPPPEIDGTPAEPRFEDCKISSENGY